MPFQISPGVNVSEIDLTTIVPAVSTTVGAIGGVFSWGPVESRTLISTEDELVNVFGKPTANNFETFFTASNFLAYGNQLYVSRAAGTTNFNAIANTVSANMYYTANSTTMSPVVIKKKVDFETQDTTLQANVNNFIAKYPGSLGNSLLVSVCPSATAYSSAISANSTSNVEMSIALGSSVLTINCIGTAAASMATAIGNSLTPGDYILIGNTSIGTQYVQAANATATVVSGTNVYLIVNLNDISRLKTNWDVNQNSGTVATRYWQFFNSVNGAPGTSNYVAQRNANTSIGDQVHIVVQDDEGSITGVPGQILEVWTNVSRAIDAKGEQGGSIYYRDVLKNNSRWIWAGRDLLGTGTAANLGAASTSSVVTQYFGGGGNDDAETSIAVAKIMTAYDQFASSEDVDISLVLAGKAYGGSGEQVPNYIIDNIVESRKDCVAFISPPTSATVNVPGFESANVIAFRNLLRSTSYAVIDSGAKYQYDKYNDNYHFVPMNGDIAGLCVRTDNTRDPWFSPAGFSRGNIKNIVKLAFNPKQADRDQLYKY